VTIWWSLKCTGKWPSMPCAGCLYLVVCYRKITKVNFFCYMPVYCDLLWSWKLVLTSWYTTISISIKFHMTDSLKSYFSVSHFGPTCSPEGEDIQNIMSRKEDVLSIAGFSPVSLWILMFVALVFFLEAQAVLSCHMSVSYTSLSDWSQPEMSPSESGSSINSTGPSLFSLYHVEFISSDVCVCGHL
jgi:hypothetical protein